MKKVLMIAFHYPPEGGSGMQRTLKFSKYLPLFGWNTYILTVKENVYELKDESFLKEIPNSVKVIRSKSLVSKKHFSIRGKYPDFLSIPDSYWSWIFDGVRVGKRIIRQENLDIIYSTSPIHTAHLIGLMLKKISKKPWIADFRDPWIGGNFRFQNSLYRLKIESWMEKQVVINCDKLICNTHPLRDDFIHRYPGLNEDRFAVIPNGYDEEDFHTIVKGTDNNRLTFVHVGEIYPNIRNPLNLLKAIKEIIEENKKIKDKLLIRFVGGGSFVYSNNFCNWIEDLGIKNNIEIVGHVPHSECINILYHSDVLLLLQQSEKVYMQIPAKTYEYMRVGRPILAICSDGATADLIRELKAGLVVRDTTEEIKNAIIKFSLQEISSVCDREKIRQYERKNLTKNLAKIFDEFVS